jgi:bifunctional non-homologous end joining protein LigD
MLAVPGRPFDSEDHFFEYKWDGIRAIAMLEDGAVRVLSRNGVDVTPRYPAVTELRALPRGLVLDGELVAFRDGRPDFELVLSRDLPASVRYVVFDVLYQDFESVMERPLQERRGLLERVVEGSRCAPLLLSEGVRGTGRTLYQRACEQDLEGVVAKRLSSSYAPGKRNGAWTKIKRRIQVQVAIIGYIEKGPRDFQSLLVAANGIPGLEGSSLRYVGRVGGGFSESAREELNSLLRGRPRLKPLVSCPERGAWVEPGLYCTVSFAEVTAAGMLRAPVFEGLIQA